MSEVAVVGVLLISPGQTPNKFILKYFDYLILNPSSGRIEAKVALECQNCILNYQNHFRKCILRKISNYGRSPNK